MCHDNEEWYKIWRRTDLLFQNWHNGFDKFWPKHSKVSKLGLWWVPFVQSLALIQAVFHVGDCFWARENRRQKNQKIIFFQDKFYSLKDHAYYFIVVIYFPTGRAAKLGIFTHFTFKNLPQCSQSINWLIYVYSIQIPSCFLWVLYQSRDRTSSHYRHPKKFLYYPLKEEDAWV